MKNNDLRESIACVAGVILTSVSDVGGTASRLSFCTPNGLNEISRDEFRIFSHADWKIDNGIFNKPIIARTQILGTKLQGPRLGWEILWFNKRQLHKTASSLNKYDDHLFFSLYLPEYEFLLNDTFGNTAYCVGCEGTGP